MLRRLPFFVAFSILILALVLPFIVPPPYSWLSGFCYILYDTSLIVFVAYKVTKFLQEQPALTPTGRRPSLTVIVPAHNEKTVFPACLKTLYFQTHQAEMILIVDDGSTDGSFEYLKEELQLSQMHIGWVSRKFPHIHVLAKERTGKADSLNQALKLIDTDLILTLDADTLLEPEAIEKIVVDFQRQESLQATGGVLRPLCIPTWQGQMLEAFQKFEYIRAYLTRQAWVCKDSLLLVSGAFAAYRTQTIKDIGGYDTNSFVEDYELIHRIYHHCYQNQIPVTIGVTAEARAVTDGPPTVIKFLRQRERWFGGFLQTIFKYRAMVGDKKFHRVGTLMLPVKSLDTLQPLYGLLALYGLISFIVFRNIPTPVWIALLAKLIIDYIYHFYCLALYNRWQKRQVPAYFWIQSLVITLLEPLFFQPLRHLGAARGWVIFLRNRYVWRLSRSN